MHLLYFFFYSVSQVDILIYTFEEEITIVGNVIDIIITQLIIFLHLILHVLVHIHFNTYEVHDDTT